MVATNLLGRYFKTDRNGKLVTSISLDDGISYIEACRRKSVAVPKLPCFVFEPQTNYERLNNIIIDHLAFSFKFSNFKDLDKAGRDWRKAVRLPVMPKRPHLDGVPLEQRDAILDKFAADSYAALFLRMNLFTFDVLGLMLSPPRDKGLHGYTNSFRITDKSGRHELGFVGLGGNSDTVYFQISGTGCKFLFEHISNVSLAWWLRQVLGVEYINRIDLAYDDFDGNFDCDYAMAAYHDGWFRKEGAKGSYPTMQPCPEYSGGKLVGNIVKVGKRESQNYWRIYDKGKEQKLDKVWFRSEVELKRVSITALSDPAKTFAGLNRFSASINIEHGIDVRRPIQRVALEMAARIRWARQQLGRTLSDVVEYLGGDINSAFGLLVDDRGGKFGLPDTHASLLNLALCEGS